jgi:hypothetical protein
VLEEEIVKDPFTDYEVIDKGNTSHDHYFVEDPIHDPNTNLMSIFCTGCPHGQMIDGDKFNLKDGKVVEIT